MNPPKHLAQANIAWMRHPLEDSRMSEFRENLSRVNAAAEEAPGFIWRFQTEEGNATGVRVLDDPLLLFNMSVWESIAHLKGYSYHEVHGDFFRRRRKWFRPAERPSLVLWWVDADHLPTVREAMLRFDMLWRGGPSPEAFSFKTAFDPTGSGITR